jgi:4-diphosphocytidyl-2-C-methyl-D-erythritol kinase
MTETRHATGAVVENAPAKVNLTLQIVGKRPDGYHLLDSLVAFTAYGDTVEAAHADGLRLRLDGPFGAPLRTDTAENLIVKAARLLAAAAGIEPRAELRLIKRLPVASGIGGGSSDAAAALRALSRLWRLDLADSDMQAIALKLGADVPVCLKSMSARLEGIGERVTPVATLPPAPIVLVNPMVGLATPKVFGARSGGFSAGAGTAGAVPAPLADARALAAALAPYPNDLTTAAIGLLPVIGDMLSLLEVQPGSLAARMSGSGATCFGLFQTAAEAEGAARQIQASQPGWWCVATELV